MPRNLEDEELYGGPADPPAPENVEPTPSADPLPIKGTSGFDYSGNWDNVGPGRTWNMGDRPPSKEDWENFSPEERAAFGIDNIEAAREAWQERWRQGGDLYQGGSTGGGSGVASSVPLNKGGSFDEAGYNRIMSALQASESGPYDKATLDRAKAQLFATTQGRVKAEQDALGRDLIRRGVSRSGEAIERSAGIERDASSQFGAGYQAVLVKAVEANYEARMSALQQEANLMIARQQALLTGSRNAIDQQIAQANIALGYARINAEKDNLQLQLSSAYDLAKMGNSQQLLLWMLQQGMEVPEWIYQ